MSGGTLGVTPRELAVLRRRTLSPGGNGIACPVAEGAVTLTIPLVRREQDAAYGVIASVSWLSTVAVTAKTPTGFTLAFGSAAPTGATVDYSVFRSE